MKLAIYIISLSMGITVNSLVAQTSCTTSIPSGITQQTGLIDYYNDFPNDNLLKLDHVRLWKPGAVYYWHGMSIQAGYSGGPDINGYPVKIGCDQAPCPTSRQYETWGSIIEDGFIIDDGFYNSMGLNSSDDVFDKQKELLNPRQVYCDDLLAGLPRYPWNSCQRQGYGILRADNQVLLENGFMVLGNPHSYANLDHHNSYVWAEFKINPTDLETVTVIQIDQSGNPWIIKSGSENVWAGTDGNTIQKDANGNDLITKGGKIYGGSDGSIIQTDGAGHELITGLSEPTDCPYFHAYTGDRFACQDLWTDQEGSPFDFTSSAYTSLSDLNSTIWGPMNGCTSPSKFPADTRNGFNYDPAMVGFALDGNGGHLLNLTNSNSPYCSDLPSSGGGLWTDNDDDPRSTKYSMYYGKFSVEAKLSSGIGVAPAIWGFLGPGQVAINPLLAKTSAQDPDPPRPQNCQDEIDVEDANGKWFVGDYGVWWDQNLSKHYDWETVIGNATYNSEDKIYHYNVGAIAQCANPTYQHLTVKTAQVVSFKSIPNNTSNCSFSDDFHTYSYEWLPGEVRSLLDGIEVGRSTRGVPYNKLSLWITNQFDNKPYVDCSIQVKKVIVQNWNPDGCTGLKSSNSHTTSQENKNPNGYIVLFDPLQPNPSNNEVKLVYAIGSSNPQETELRTTLELLDVLGKQISLVQGGMVQPGKYTMTVKTKDLPAGEYFFRLSVYSQVQTQKLVVIH